jgi:DNA-directed RNA polymerase sigma subunit (sigma70/sigma32)
VIDSPGQLEPDHPAVRELLVRGRRDGCIELSELSEAVGELELDEDSARALSETIESEGIELKDDCGRAGLSPRYGINGDDATTIREIGRRLGIPGRQVQPLEEQALRRLASEREIEALRDAA